MHALNKGTWDFLSNFIIIIIFFFYAKDMQDKYIKFILLNEQVLR